MLRSLLLLGCLTPLLADSVLVDPLTDGAAWQLGGHRINYQLGRSSVGPSAEQTRPGFATTLRLTYDFSDPRRQWLSYYHLGPAIPGDCRSLSFQLYGDGGDGRLRLAIEDARGRWFQREVGRIDWTGWREVATTLEPESWRPLTRIGETPLPPLMPINLREIAVMRGLPEQASGAVWISELRAETEVAPLDQVGCQLSLPPDHLGAAIALTADGPPPAVTVLFANRANQPLRARLDWQVLDYLERVVSSGAGDLTLPAQGELRQSLTDRLRDAGSYQVRVVLTADGTTREWHLPLALASMHPRRPNRLFGVHSNIAGVVQREQPLVERLNAASGCGWTRISMNWAEINPAEGSWAWSGAARVDGAMGRALLGSGSSLELPYDPRFDLPAGLTIAFWSKLDGSNGNWQWPIYHEGLGGERERAWGVFFGRDTGELTFSAGFASRPEVGHVDLGSGFSGWDGRWHHCAVSYDPAAKLVTFHIDGKLVRSVAQPGGPLRPARSPVRIASSYAGALDELRVFDRALTTDEVALLAAKQPGPTDGLVMGWTFDEPDGAFRDLSGGGFDLAPAEPFCIQQVREARRQGLQVLGILGFPPVWASTAAPGDPRPAQHEPILEAWETYVEETVRHYADVIDHWELWNEPNIRVFWEPEPDPQTFARIAIAGYHAAKRGNPNAVVMTPALAGPHGNGDRLEFLDTILAAGVKDATDAISIHPYRQTTPEESDLVGELRHIHEASGGKPIWYTEMCWTNQIPGGSVESRTAQMLVRCVALSLGSGLVDKIIWFRFHDPGVDRFYTEHNYGLCANDLTPKPAWFAFRTCADLLEEAQPAGDWDLGEGAIGRLFSTEQGKVAVVWSPDGPRPVAIRTASQRVTTVDPMGNGQPIATPDQVWLGQVDETPLFLTGLGEQAAPTASPLTAQMPRLATNATGVLSFGVSNPGARAMRAKLLLTVADGIRLGAPEITELELAAGEARTVPVPVTAGAEPGVRTLTAALTLGDTTLRRDVTVAVHTAAADAGPVGWWKFDEGQGTTLADSSGHGLTGTVAAPRWVDGRSAKALEFAAGAIATVPPSPLLDLADEVTVAFWIKPTADTGTWQFPLTRFFNENVVRNYGVYLAPGQLQPAFSTSPVDDPSPHRDVRAGTGLTIGQWHHIAARYSLFDSVCRVFLDGRPVATQTLGGPMKLVPDQPLRIGVATKAVIDDVRVWPRALSDEEVARLVE